MPEDLFTFLRADKYFILKKRGGIFHTVRTAAGPVLIASSGPFGLTVTLNGITALDNLNKSSDGTSRTGNSAYSMGKSGKSVGAGRCLELLLRSKESGRSEVPSHLRR